MSAREAKSVERKPLLRERVTVLVIIGGYVASALVFATFCMKSQFRLRQVAIASNVAFIIYGSVAGVYPLLVLHGLMLPLNAWRLVQWLQVRRAIEVAVARTDLSIEWLMPFMKRITIPAHAALFNKNDAADEVYCIMEGSVKLVETGIVLGPGTLLGEIGIFSPLHLRTQTARAEMDVDLLVISHDELLTLYRRHPEFGIFLIKLVTKRLLEDEAFHLAQLTPVRVATPS